MDASWPDYLLSRAKTPSSEPTQLPNQDTTSDGCLTLDSLQSVDASELDGVGVNLPGFLNGPNPCAPVYPYIMAPGDPNDIRTMAEYPMGNLVTRIMYNFERLGCGSVLLPVDSSRPETYEYLFVLVIVGGPNNEDLSPIAYDRRIYLEIVMRLAMERNPKTSRLASRPGTPFQILKELLRLEIYNTARFWVAPFLACRILGISLVVVGQKLTSWLFPGVSGM